MTLPDGMNSNHQQSTAGTGLAQTDAPGGIDPFLATADAAVPPAARSWHAKMLDYSAHAAMIVGLIGFAWSVSGHVVTREPAAPAPIKTAAATPSPVLVSAPVAAAPETPKTDELAELRRANHQMAADIKTLHASLDTLRASLAKAPEQMRALTAGVEEVKSGLAAAKGETHAEVAQLSTKVDALRHEHEAAAKPAPAPDRVAKADHPAPDPAPTGSIPVEPLKVPTPPAKPASLATAEETPTRQVITGWVVRDVYEGVAYLEGKRGTMEVVPGVSIPGAGVVKSIDRHGAGWTVTTTKGLVAYAAPARETRRAPTRDYYPMPYDY